MNSLVTAGAGEVDVMLCLSTSLHLLGEGLRGRLSRPMHVPLSGDAFGAIPLALGI